MGRFPLTAFVPFSCLPRSIFASFLCCFVSESCPRSWKKRGDHRQREKREKERPVALTANRSLEAEQTKPRPEQVKTRQGKSRQDKNSPAHISPIQPPGTENAPPIESTYPRCPLKYPQAQAHRQTTYPGTYIHTYKSQTGTGRPTIPRTRRDPIDPTTTSRGRLRIPLSFFLPPPDCHELV